MNSLPVEGGAAVGLVRLLTPTARILVFGCLLAACLIAPPGAPPGLAFVWLSLVLWLTVCRPSARMVRMVCRAGTMFFLPLLVLLSLAAYVCETYIPGGADAIAVMWNVSVKSVCSLFLSLGLAAQFSAGEFHQGLSRLPLPRTATAILGQMVHQMDLLVEETRGILSALTVRGASGPGRAFWRLLVALPQVWLPRLAGRAERLAVAMEARGFDGTVPGLPGRPWRLADTLALLAACAWTALAVGIRWQWGE